MRRRDGAEPGAAEGGVHVVRAMSEEQPGGDRGRGERRVAEVDEHDGPDEREVLDGAAHARAKGVEVVRGGARGVGAARAAKDILRYVRNHLLSASHLLAHRFTKSHCSVS